MSDKSVSFESLQRTKRYLVRQISNSKSAADTALLENPSEDVAHRIAAFLDTWHSNLQRLEDINNDILDNTDFKGKSVDQVATMERSITKEHDQSQLSYDVAKGKLNAMFGRLHKPVELTSRRSLDSSVVGQGTVSNALVKLPDIPVPKFNGKLGNFTEWHSLFSAMIDKNDNLQPVQKLYFLKQALTGDAANLLKDHTLQEGAYDSAFKYIEERYYNRRALIATHFHDLMELPTVTFPTLRETLDKVNAIIRGLRVCNLEVEKMSPLIAYIVVRKLPERLRTEWENSHLDYSTYPSFEPLATFLQNRCFAYESVHPEGSPKPTATQKKESQEKKIQKTGLAAVQTSKGLSPASAPSPRCLLCEKGHFISQCEQFLEKSVSDRFAFVRQRRLCTNCLRQFHLASACNSSKCRKCNKAHHTLLHREIPSSSSEEMSSTQSDRSKSDASNSDTAKTSAAAVANKEAEIVLLPSAVVLVQIGSEFVKARVLIDPCAQMNLVADSFVRKHGLKTHKAFTKIEGVTPGELDSTISVSLKLKSRFNKYEVELVADVVSRVPYRITPEVIKKIKSLGTQLQLADCSLPYSSVDILIGGRWSNRILLGKKKFFGDFCLEKSQFGWVAEGDLSSAADPESFEALCCNVSVRPERDIFEFFEVEEVSAPAPILGEHERCEAHFLSTYTRLETGKFQVRLPRAQPLHKFANTYKQALASLLRFERSLDAETRAMYVDFMTEYRTLNHMRLTVNFEVPRYIIPHLFVLRMDSTSTVFRSVFNASTDNASGISLNAGLLVGPKLQPDLFDLLLRFRLYPIAFAADISKMYRQIQVHPDDWPLQSILWRDHPSEPIQVYELTTITYGTSPAPYLATKCLQMLALEVKESQPDIHHAISSEFYMDDLLTGAESVKAAIDKQQSIQSKLDSAHFPLRKYVSNSAEFIASLDPSLVESLKPVEFSSDGAAKILGLQWQPAEDCFTIQAKPKDISNVVLTKRAIASLAAQAFDPMGFAAPVIIRAKILLQDLWREGKGWDDPVSQELDKAFREYYTDLAVLSLGKIPRFYTTWKGLPVDVVAFCDASPRAYGAAIYLRVHQDTETRPMLVCAKSKVAPLKAHTIPRLELLGAVLLTRLLQRVCKTLDLNVAASTAFCDSTVVLAWLKGPSSKYQVFVRNRVEFLNSILPFSQWRYVNTAENPADLLTRGIAVKSFIENSLWIKGPDWLSKREFKPSSVALPDELLEVRKVVNVSVSECTVDETLISRYSDFDKLVRIFSLVWKFVSRSSSKFSKFDSLDQRTRSLYLICRISQVFSFRSEITALQAGHLLPAKSSVNALSPFLDAYGLLRVTGRLSNSKLAYDTQHPIILSRRSVLPELLVRHTHERYFHAYRSFTLAFIQSRFWFVGGTAQLVKKVIHDCIFCTRMRGESLTQLMGELPLERTSVSRPFATTGVDLAGPFTIRCTNHRSKKHMKYYVAFFVCFATRAVHLEHVSDLSTDAFIAALQRFSARRGIPHTLWSDNATNFVGTRNVLERHCQSLGIKWKFIPARSPHHGGLWESAVKAGKKHLVAAAHGMVLNSEQFVTILAVIESIMNSRPLYRKREVSDPESIDALTPGHFLVGSHLLHAAAPETSSASLNERLALQSQVVRTFWKLWSQSYAAQLQTRSKWKSESSNLAVGDLVLIKDESPPLQWPMAKVSRLLPDKLSRVRVVEVTAKGSTYLRSVQKLIKLPVEGNG